jgi:hypothetical protein
MFEGVRAPFESQLGDRRIGHTQTLIGSDATVLGRKVSGVTSAPGPAPTDGCYIKDVDGVGNRLLDRC